MNTRQRVLLTTGAAALAAALTACGSAPGTDPLAIPSVNRLPPGAEVVTTNERQRDPACDATASLRPGAQPSPGNMPAGSTMATIVASGKVRIGVDQNLYPMGYRDPATGQIAGFDIDIAREIARDLFGDPNKIEMHPIESAQRIPALTSGQVDLVVQTLSATCERAREISFSTTYFAATQRILAVKGSGIASSADLAGKTVCELPRTTTLDTVLQLPSRPTIITMNNWLDCLTALQQGQVDAVSTDTPILAGLIAQDPNLELVGETLAVDDFAVGIPKQATDLVRFVNGVLDRIRSDGTWQRLYNARLNILGPASPPAPKYVE
ncbi:glutamate ABC transporter substrate-binding protein [Nocardia sp. 2]|uniref:Glutamate ABC transporter substrate-binding protein n=1 Tax=Nocardia acididurans TaxID=2802282 RepID=A0ABS1M0T2_9NOCA|nr:glutamate ABC transporter substrate-binding protein [Nocardia acididurans]MBL1074277.1 glutamate ABC transporter substrate-binding protein [Nocardia acididurans]